MFNIETPVLPIKIIHTVYELDLVLKELDAAILISDDALRSTFKTFEMKILPCFSHDPFSDEYKQEQFKIFEKIAGKSYNPKNEVSAFNLENAINKPFPFYTESSTTVGNHIMAIGNLIKRMALPAGSSILEIGPGWGNTTIWLAQMGYKVTAVDIEENFIKLFQARAEKLNLDINLIHGDFLDAQKLDDKWDEVLFFDSFHHCAEHQKLIQYLDQIVNKNGKLVFAAEPISDGFPIPWGIRLDGESLWAIRNFGWCELGFQETYFRKLMNLNN